MKQLSDLLDEATAGAPPPRYDVEDAVAAGRRLQRRRNTGWAIAAVTAVAVAIGVPQIATRRSAPPVEPVVTTTTTPAVQPRAFTYPFPAYAAGRFRVGDPSTVTLGAVKSVIRPATEAGTVSGYLTVYQPGLVGVGSIFGSWKNVEEPPINGRRAVFLQSKTAGAGPMTSGLAWEYTDGGWVFAWSWLGRMKPADLTRIVKMLPTGPARPVRVAYRMASVPAGYRLVQVDGPDPSGGTVSGAYLALPASGAEQTSEEGYSLAADDLGDTVLIRLLRLGANERSKWPATEPACPAKKQYCYQALDGGRYLLQVSSGTARAGRAELLRTLRAITVADADDPGTWIDVNRALPASAQLPAK